MNLTLELSGLNLERLLRAAGACGVRMKNVRRVDERTMRVVVPAAQKKRMAALCEKYGWQMAEIRAGGLLRLARSVKRRWTLGLSVLLSCFWVYLASEMIWRVEIDGAGENAAEVHRCLEAENARVARLQRRVSTDHLADALALAVPGLAHAAARYEGSTLGWIVSGRARANGQAWPDRGRRSSRRGRALSCASARRAARRG